jgi:signal transduction histidine kinase
MIERVLAVGSITASGTVLAAAGVASVLAASGTVAVGLSALGVVLGLALAAGSAYLYASDVRTSHTVRIAGWNLLGAVLLGTILALAVGGAGVDVPAYVLVDVLGVSSVAHVLIGYNDVRRIRAEDLARQRRTLAVVNRLTRHNLRNGTQVLTARAGQLVEGVDDPDLRAAAENLRDRSLELSTIHEELQSFQRALDGDDPEGTVAVDEAVERVLADYREDHPDAFEVDVPDGLTVRADDQFDAALDHLVENALEHGSDGDPFVRVTAERDGETVRLTVADRGPGISETEVAVLTGEREIDQLEHTSGLGLWVVKAIVDRYRGTLAFDTTDGTAVTMTLEAA